MEEEKPLSIGGVLDRGFAVYRQSLLSVLPLTVIGALMPLLPRLIFPPSAMVQGNRVDSAHAGAYFGLVMLMSFVAFALWIGVIRKQDDVASGRNALDIREAFTGGLRFFLPAVGAGILYALIMMVGFVLLVVPGIIFSVSLSLSLFALVLDGAGVTGSLGRSRALVRGHWWRTATILTVAMLIYMAVYVGVMALLMLVLPVGNIFSVSTGSAAPNALIMLLFSLVLGLFNAVLAPLMYAMALVTYRDLRLRKSGGDLAARIAATA